MHFDRTDQIKKWQAGDFIPGNKGPLIKGL
jgi:hypothetical protein